MGLLRPSTAFNMAGDPEENSPTQALLAFVRAHFIFLLVALPIARFLFRRYASPLRKYPGPFLASGSRAWKGEKLPHKCQLRE